MCCGARHAPQLKRSSQRSGGARSAPCFLQGLHHNVIPSDLVTLRNVTTVWLRGTGRSCIWKPFTRKSSRPVARLDGTLWLFRERPGQAKRRFPTARVVTRRASLLWFRHLRRPSESCRGFVRSVEQVKPERPSLSALCGAPAWGPPVCGTVRIRERCVRRSRPDAQECRPSQLYCRDIARAEG